jgi:hypothetical protein
MVADQLARRSVVAQVAQLLVVAAALREAGTVVLRSVPISLLPCLRLILRARAILAFAESFGNNRCPYRSDASVQ